MSNAKKLIIVLFSILAGLLAVKAYTMLTRPGPEPPEAGAKTIAEVQEKAIQKTAERAVQRFSQTVPKGMRIAAIRVNEVTGVARNLSPQDRVDVIAVTDINGTQGGKMARAVLQNVEIFTAETSSAKIKNKKDWTLQLLVTLEQAVILSSVDEAAELRLVLRNPEDTDTSGLDAFVYSPESGPVRETDLVSDFSGRVIPGMRAISLEIDNKDGICDQLRPGDRVDLIMSSKVSRFSTQGGNQAVGTKGEVHNLRKSSKILLQNVEVLATDLPFGLKYGKKSATMVSLMVTPQQAEKIAVVMDTSKSGVLRLILRNPGDRQRILTRGEIFSDQVLKDKQSFQVIDTVRGTQVQPRKFYQE